MPARKPSPAQIRDRRARIAVVVLGLVLLAVGGIQGPKLLKLLSGSNSSSSATAAQTGQSTTTGQAGSSTTGQPASATPGVVVSTPSAGQIAGFGLFSPQDPFRSQMPVAAGDTGASGATTQTATTTTQAATTQPATTQAATTQAATTQPATTQPATTQATTTRAATTTPTQTTTVKQPPVPPVTFTTTTAPTGVVAAVLKINGKRALIGIGGTFPQKTPLFRFASLAGKRLRIGVVGGSFADGRPFLMLQPGSEVTLLNESDGTRFVVRFVQMTNAPLDMLASPGPTAGAVPPGGFQPGATPTTPSKTTTTG
jgi:hypothetical protein